MQQSRSYPRATTFPFPPPAVVLWCWHPPSGCPRGCSELCRNKEGCSPSHTDHHWSTGAPPLLPQDRGAADLHQELTGTAQLPSLGRAAREEAAGFGARRAPRGGRAASSEVNNASLVPWDWQQLFFLSHCSSRSAL